MSDSCCNCCKQIITSAHQDALRRILNLLSQCGSMTGYYDYSCEHMLHNIASIAYCLYTAITVIHLSLQVWFVKGTINAQSHVGRGFAIVFDGAMSAFVPEIADNLPLAGL